MIICFLGMHSRKEKQNLCLKSHNIIVGLQKNSGQKVSNKCFGGFIAWFQQLNNYKILDSFTFSFSSETQFQSKIRNLIKTSKIYTRLLILNTLLKFTEIKDNLILAYFSIRRTCSPIFYKKRKEATFQTSCLEILQYQTPY